MKPKFIKVECENGELVLLHKENSRLILHVGYSEAEFTNKQIDELMKAIKETKVMG